MGRAAVGVGVVDRVRVRSDPSRPRQLDVASLAGRRGRARAVRVGTAGRRGGLVASAGRRLRGIASTGSPRGRCCRWPADWLAPLLTMAGRPDDDGGDGAGPAGPSRGGAEPGAHLDRGRPGAEGTPRVPAHRPGAAPPGRRRNPRTGTGRRTSRVPSRRLRHRHRRQPRRVGRGGGRVEQAAAQSMLDLRPLAARQAEGWVASLPVGRTVRPGAWP